MGKNHRHKKHLKSEKAKIKLKTAKTKFLPKGQNVTDLSFKIKPIVLPEQLRSKGDEVVSSRKLNLKEILNRLTHYNATVKHDNCQQLRELIYSENKEFLQQNLGRILKSVGPLLLDIEHKVRREAIKVVGQILQLSTSATIVSFFDILSSFLRCAMTHINQNVQEDSLNFLDILLTYIPELVAVNSHKILNNFFTLISKHKTNSKHARTISENLQSKYTGVKWRVAVLVRLKKIFEVMYEMTRTNIHSNDHEMQERFFDISKSSYAPIYVDKYDVIKQARNKQHFDDEHIENYVNILLPLLQETWLEVAPSNITTVTSGTLQSTIIKHDVACTLNCLLMISLYLYKLRKASDDNIKLKDAYFNLLNIILLSFPYMGAFEKKHEEFGVNNDVRCTEENLTISFLFCSQYKHLRGKVLTGYAQKVIEYMNHCFTMFVRNADYMKNDGLNELFSSIVKVILTTNLRTWRQAGLEIGDFIENTIDYYLKSANYNAETELLTTLYDVMDPMSGKRFLLAEKCCNHLLEAVISIKMLNFLLLMVKKDVKCLQECLQSKLSSILGNVFNVKIKGVDMELLKITKILSLFQYVPLNDEDKGILQKFGCENPLYTNLISSIIKN